jgi:hypothetical protein
MITFEITFEIGFEKGYIAYKLAILEFSILKKMVGYNLE